MTVLTMHRPAIERVPEIKAAWDRVQRLEALLTAAQANKAQQLVIATGRRNVPR